MSLENTMATFAIVFIVAAVSALIVAAGQEYMGTGLLAFSLTAPQSQDFP
jgi:hypothetical protein